MKRLLIPVLVLRPLVGCTATGSSPTSPSALSSLRPSAFSSPNSGGKPDLYIANDPAIAGSDQNPVDMGFMPTWSPDRTLIAFLQIRPDPHPKSPDPGDLQVWLIRPDASGLRKLGQERGCCLGARPSLVWSQDGSSVILTGIRSHRIDVATGESRLVTTPIG